MLIVITLALLLVAMGSTTAVATEPCPPPSQFQGRPYFDFQVDKAAAYIGSDSARIKPSAERVAQPYPADFALVQFVVDSVGAPIPGTLKLLMQPAALSKDSVMFSLVQWRYQPARVGDCRVPQLVQTPLRWK